MTDEHDKPEQEAEEQPEPGETRRLEKAIQDMESGDIHEGTLVDIVAHTGEHAKPPEPSVTDALKQVKKGQGPDVQPAATMYEPTRPGHVSGGSTQQTVFGPTGTGGNTPQSGTLNAPSGARPIAPFGGKIVVGTRIGQIEVTGVLGKGGMGEVFKGYHHALDINVAIKVLPDELSRNELVRQRFLREARLCVKLDHPHIVRVYNVDEYAGNLYLVMEMIEGTDAANMLKNGGRFRYKRALEIGAASADALAYAHTQGLVHRDVKPHNILLGAADGKIKLSDFGLARAATSSSHLTMSGQIMGTPHYMSPEQAEAKEVTDKSDVYSLGVTIYHMLTGETPFVGDTPISVAVQHIAKEIIYPEIRFKPFPKELVAVLKRMTAKDPAKRCSAKQAAVWLRKLIAMAPEDDIAAGDEGAMKSMAPVVRESQAFEAAAKERQQRDQHARELAQTMLATIQEESGRRVQVQPTMQEAAPAYTTQAPAKKGSGGLVAALVLIIGLMGGGGFAGWYFTMGPGAQKPNNAPIISGGNVENRETPPRANENRAPENVPPSNVGGNTAANNAPANNAPDDGGELPPPEEVDDPALAGYLAGAMSSITDANTLQDLDAVKRKLDQAWLVIKGGKGSEKQRQDFDELKSRWEQQHAYLAASESFERIRDALAGVEEKRGGDRAAAIAYLNTAIKERDALAGMKVDGEAAELIASDRDALVAKVNDVLEDFWSELDSEAARLEEKKQYTEAMAILGDLATIRHSAEKQAQAALRLQTVRVLDLHKLAGAHLQTEQYKDALDKLAKAKDIGVPDSLAAAQDELQAAVTKAIRDKLNAHLEAAIASADKGDFTTALNERDAAGRLPVLDSDQADRVANADFYVKLSEQVTDAEKAVAGSKFTEAESALDRADTLVKEARERAVPEALQRRLAQTRVDLDREVAKRFEQLLAAATSDMERKDFTSATANLAEADDLPLNKQQQDRLDAFTKENESALAGFVSGLIDKIEKALDTNDFDGAKRNLAATEALSVPDALKPRLEALSTRFATEAIRRHGELLDAAREALRRKDYFATRDNLAAAEDIPVATTEQDKARELRDEYIKLLTAEVSGHLDAADKLTEDEKFLEAKREIDEAAKLPLEGELERRYKAVLQRWFDAVDDKLNQLLKAAQEARESDLYSASDGYLDQASALPTNPEQAIAIKVARDLHNSDLKAYKARLFKQLEDAIKKGNEKEGKRIAELIQKHEPDIHEKAKLEKLLDELTGEPTKDRYNRLPSHLKKIWDDKFCKPEQVIQIGEEITALAISADGKFGAAGTRSGKIHFYNLKRGTQLGTSRGGTRPITSMAVSTDGTFAACGNDDGATVVFDLSGNSPQAYDLGNIGDDVLGMAFNSGATVLYAAGRDGVVARFNPRTRAKLGTTPTGLDSAQCLAISPNDNWLAVGGDEGRIALFDAVNMTIKKTLQSSGDETIQSVAFSADSSQLIGGSIENKVGIWSTRKLDEKPVKEYSGLSEWVRGVGFSNDGVRCVAFDNEDRLVVWDVRTGQEQRPLAYSEKLKGQKDFKVTAGFVAPDGTLLIGTREGELLHMYVKSPTQK
ncbi:MAG: protein kinase [Planctomycetes bacterium]|nr:protein kinase [Planctomycetota bacterium]MCB9935265.1 protein kinase [Planctomycetota bacterium]